MPRNTREWALRKLEFASGNMTTARKHIAEVVDRYAEQEPELASNMLALDTMLAQMDSVILKIRSSF